MLCYTDINIPIDVYVFKQQWIGHTERQKKHLSAIIFHGRIDSTTKLYATFSNSY